MAEGDQSLLARFSHKLRVGYGLSALAQQLVRERDGRQQQEHSDQKKQL